MSGGFIRGCQPLFRAANNLCCSVWGKNPGEFHSRSRKVEELGRGGKVRDTCGSGEDVLMPRLAVKSLSFFLTQKDTLSKNSANAFLNC